MAKLFSNELKAIVVPEDFLENPKNVLKENCLVVQHFDYQAEHKRNSAGEVYGPTEPVMHIATTRSSSMPPSTPINVWLTMKTAWWSTATC